MRYAVIVSEKDMAGMNIKHTLRSLFDFKESGKFKEKTIYEFGNVILYTVEEETVFCEHLDKEIIADVFVFATRHQGKAGVLSLNIHSPGNWDKAGFGGEDNKLAMSWANLNRTLYLDLKNKTENTNFEVTLECTHHGPLIGKPTLFIEIGSSDKEWGNKHAAEILSKTLIDMLVEDIPENATIIGLGGPHYCSNFNKVMTKTKFAISHICPKYMLPKLTETKLKEAIGKTKEHVEFVLLDWKGMGTEKQNIIKLLENINMPFKRIDQI